MREVGVSPKQTGKARQAFMRSPRQAGFFAHGEDRLVRPSFPNGPATRPIDAVEPPDPNRGKSGGGGGGDGTDQEMIRSIRGLIARLRIKHNLRA